MNRDKLSGSRIGKLRDRGQPTGVKGFLHGLFVPHSHDAADSIDDALEANKSGIRALKISLLILLATTVLQAIVVAFSGSVALLADTVHNFSDALAAVPLWAAFILGRRAASRRFTYGLGRAEDLAGLFIVFVFVFVVALSAVVAAWQSIDRILHPQPLANIGWVIAAGTKSSQSTASASANASAPQRSSPTAFTPEPTDSLHLQLSPAESASSSASASPTRSSA